MEPKRYQNKCSVSFNLDDRISELLAQKPDLMVKFPKSMNKIPNKKNNQLEEHSQIPNLEAQISNPKAQQPGEHSRLMAKISEIMAKIPNLKAQQPGEHSQISDLMAKKERLEAITKKKSKTFADLAATFPDLMAHFPQLLTLANRRYDNSRGSFECNYNLRNYMKPKHVLKDSRQQNRQTPYVCRNRRGNRQARSWQE